MVCGKLPAVAKNAAIACGLSHRMQTQRQCHQAASKLSPRYTPRPTVSDVSVESFD